MTWFRRAGATRSPVRLTVDGRTIEAAPGESVATALLAAGLQSLGDSPVTGAPLAAHCLIGNCFGCLCTIDGRRGSQACLTPVADGMVVATDAGEPGDDRR